MSINGYEAEVKYPDGKSYVASRDEAASMFYQLCIEKYKDDKINDAIECINLAFTCDPKNALVLYMRGLLEEKTNSLEAAAKDYDASIQYNPRYAPAYAHRGALKGRKADYGGALADLKKAWLLAPNNAQVAFQLGQTLVVMDKKKEARKYLKFAVKNGIPAAQSWLDKCNS